MDTVTHFAAGALTPLIFRRAPKTRMMILFGIIAGEFPDIDVIAGKAPEAILAFHRGPTHALVLQPLSALVLTLVFHRLIKRGDESGSWTFANTWSVALLALLIHLFLDCMTTFGTQIFLPFSDFRVALPAIYIIDLLLTLPLLATLGFILWRWRRSPANALPARDNRTVLARRAVAWMVAYPLLALGLNHAIAASLTAEYATNGNSRNITSVELSPEPFAPLNWKVVAVAPDTYYMARFFLPSPGEPLRFTEYNRPDAALWQSLQQECPLFGMYANFTTYPFEKAADGADATVMTFADVRYEATLPDLMDTLGRKDGLFLMQARFEKGKFSAYRFLYRGRDADTPWQQVKKDPAHAG